MCRSVKETDWRSELHAFGKGVADDTHLVQQQSAKALQARLSTTPVKPALSALSGRQSQEASSGPALHATRTLVQQQVISALQARLVSSSPASPALSLIEKRQVSLPIKIFVLTMQPRDSMQICAARLAALIWQAVTAVVPLQPAPSCSELLRWHQHLERLPVRLERRSRTVARSPQRAPWS